MDKPRSKRRFIAGAVCPNCRALDRLQLVEETGAEGPRTSRECIECGFKDDLVHQVASAEPEGRLQKSRKGRDLGSAADAQVVRIVDPSQRNSEKS